MGVTPRVTYHGLIGWIARRPIEQAVELRPMTLADGGQVLAWRNQPDVARFMCDDRPITPEQHARWMTDVLASDTRRYWIVEHRGCARGVINLADIDWDHRRCSWGFYLGEPDTAADGTDDRLHMSDALRRVAEIAFIDLQLDKLCAQVLSSNERSLALHERIGFVREGVLRAHVRRTDGVHDLVLLSMLRSEWDARREGALEIAR
jgi:UDP-4-amino-4,6-dideoxy-N-acetyl-beta-L-altrosamine N-acetyltransferase